jgi:hypothetical protein
MKTNTRKRLNNKNRSKKKHKRQNGKTRRQKKMSGGLLFGDGSFGKVYGTPRLLCNGETKDTRNIDKEVSKLFREDEKAEEEIMVNARLKTRFSPDELQELKQYCLLPIKICDINERSLLNKPYTTNEWRKNSKGDYGKNREIFTETKGLPDRKGEQYRKMVIYDEGGKSVSDHLDEIASVEDFMSCLTKIINIGKGIQLLQKKGFIHGDIKPENAIEHEGNFKLIDLTDVRIIDTSIDSKAMPTAFGYFTWPSISIYTYAFDEIDGYDASSPHDVFINKSLLNELYNENKSFNDNMYLNRLKKYYIEPFNIKEEYGFTEKEVEYVSTLSRNLILEKTFYARESPLSISELERLPREGGFLTILNRSEYVSDFIEKYNRIFSSFTNLKDLKNDLFKRIDIYSFGMIILDCIGVFINLPNVADYFDADSKLKILILSLYDFAARKCCVQRDKVANIDEIIDIYEKIVLEGCDYSYELNGCVENASDQEESEDEEKEDEHTTLKPRRSSRLANKRS